MASHLCMFRSPAHNASARSGVCTSIHPSRSKSCVGRLASTTMPSLSISWARRRSTPLRDLRPAPTGLIATRWRKYVPHDAYARSAPCLWSWASALCVSSSICTSARPLLTIPHIRARSYGGWTRYSKLSAMPGAVLGVQLVDVRLVRLYISCRTRTHSNTIRCCTNSARSSNVGGIRAAASFECSSSRRPLSGAGAGADGGSCAAGWGVSFDTSSATGAASSGRAGGAVSTASGSRNVALAKRSSKSMLCAGTCASGTGADPCSSFSVSGASLAHASSCASGCFCAGAASRNSALRMDAPALSSSVNTGAGAAGAGASVCVPNRSSRQIVSDATGAGGGGGGYGPSCRLPVSVCHVR